MYHLQPVSEELAKKVLTQNGLWDPTLIAAICCAIGNTQCEPDEQPNCSSLVFLSAISRKPELKLVVEDGFVPRMVVYPNTYRLERDRYSLKGICSDHDLRFEEVEDDGL